MKIICIPGMGHEAFDFMIPFDGLYNIHGISTHYTDYYYNYQARDYLTCQTTEDCTSPYLWCETSSQECYTKVSTKFQIKILQYFKSSHPS